jgi:perosamine synthetase
MSLTLQPRLRLDIGWSDLFSAFAPASGDWRATLAGLFQRPALPCLSVRTAFDTLLQAIEAKPGDEIVLSAINIESMAAVAEAHGVSLVPVDIDVRTMAPTAEAIDSALSPRTRLILIAHLFGARLSLAPYAGVKPESVLLVEDCAQAWRPDFAPSPEADVSLLSFGPIKRRTALGGAVALFRDASLANTCAAIEASYEPMSEGWFVQRALKYCALKVATTPLLYRGIHALVQAITGDAEKAIGAAARGFPPGELLVRLRRRPPQRMVKLLHRRLTSPASDAERVAANRDVLGRLPTPMASIAADNADHHYWLTPILLDDPGAASKALVRRGYDATRGATSLRAIETEEHKAPHARALMQRVLYLPPPFKLSAKRREALARDIREVAE